VLLAEVGLDDLGIGLNGGGRAFGDLHAIIEDGDARADTHDDLHRVFHEEDGEAELFLDLLDQADELDLLGRIHAGGGFVEQEELRLGGQAADDLKPALFTVGETLGVVIAEAAEVEYLQQLLDAPGDGGFVGPEGPETKEGVNGRGPAMQVAGHPDIIKDGERTEEADVLEGAGDAALDNLVDPQPGQRPAGKGHVALGGRVDAGDEVEDRGFAGAIGADKAAKLAFIDGEVHGVDSNEAAKADRGRIELEQGGHQSFTLPNLTLNRPWGRAIISTISRKE
jgi:hypothetical protein